MIRSLSRRIVAGLVLAVSFVCITSCKKKESSGGGGNPNIAAPSEVKSDHFVFAHLNSKAVRNSAFFAELKDAFVKHGELKTWDEFEQKMAEMMGTKPSYIESTTFVIPDAPVKESDLQRLIVILVGETPIPKEMIFKERPRPWPQRPGFFQVMNNLLAHFPDEKTLVLLHPDLVDRYLAGYAKDRNTWPMSAELIAKAKEHTLLAVHDPRKWPAEARNGHEFRKFGPLFEATSAVLSIDLDGKHFHIGLRGTFASEEAANAGKAALEKLIAELSQELFSSFESTTAKDDLGALYGVVAEAKRAMTEAKIEVSGSSVTATTVFKADFNVLEIMQAAVEQVRSAASRTMAQNNLKEIGRALHNYSSAMNRLPIHGVANNGEQLRWQPDKNGEVVFNPKPLLSWRVEILPYIEEGALYKEFKRDEPWDSDHNKKLIEKMPKVFRPVAKSSGPGMTHMQQIIGAQCMLPGRFRIDNIPDGSSNTIAVIESSEPVIWTKPDDLYFAGKEADINGPPPKDLKKRFGGQFPNGFNVLLWDGSARWIDSRAISDKTLWNALRPADGNPLDGDW